MCVYPTIVCRILFMPATLLDVSVLPVFAALYTRPSTSTRYLPSALASPAALMLRQQEYKVPNLNIQKARGVSQSVETVILPSPRPRGLRPHTTVFEQKPNVIHLYIRDIMSSELIVGSKRGVPDAPVTSDDDGSHPKRGKEAEAADPKLDQAESQRNKKLKRDGEARNLSREKCKMTVIMWQIEEMEQTEKAVKAGPGSTQLEGRVGYENEKVGEKRRVRDACDAGGEAAGHGLRGERGWAGDEKLEKKRKKQAQAA